MIVGVPKEIKPFEHRVGMTPAGCRALVERGHVVLVEHQAGAGSGFSDEMYEAAGAELVSAETVYRRAELIVKVKEPLQREYAWLQPGQIVFTYLHLANDPALTKTLLERNVTGIGYETVQTADGKLPLLMPMSEIAGRMAPQLGMHYLEQPNGGSGILLSGVPGVEPGEVVILGGGQVGAEAAKIAARIGARVTVIDISLERLRELDDLLNGHNVSLVYSNTENIAKAVKRADLVIGAVLVPGARAPKLVSEEMVASMKPGSVIIDVAIDQGGCIETCDRMSTHDDPVYVKHGIIHYAVGNMPGAVPRTSTLSLTNATFRYVAALADLGVVEAVKRDPALARGVNTHAGHITHPAVAEAHALTHTPLETLL